MSIQSLLLYTIFIDKSVFTIKQTGYKLSVRLYTANRKDEWRIGQKIHSIFRTINERRIVEWDE